MKPIWKIIIGVIIVVLIVIAIYLLLVQRTQIEESQHITPTPEEILATLKYTKPVEWPPVVRTVDGPFTCTQAGNETDRAGATTKRTIHGKEYCVTVETEGAAGSTYRTYAYATVEGGQVSITTFSLRSVQCGNYDEPEKNQCEAEGKAFSVDDLVR